MNDVEKIWIADGAIHIRCVDGSKAVEYIDDYPRLKYASTEQLQNYETDKFGIHWPELNEDLEFESFFEKKDRSPLYLLFSSHPELNASAVARRLGFSQSLFAQYISGSKKPSAERMHQIIECIHAIGTELMKV